MKTLLCKIRLIRAAVLILLGCSPSLSMAQNTNPVTMFNDAASTTSFVTWWGPPNPSMTWDATRDAANDPSSGSVRYEQAFLGADGEQFMTFFTIANRWQWDGGFILDATTYTNFSFDIKVDPSSGQRKSNNDYGSLEIGLVTDGWGTIYLPTFTIPLSATDWTHVDRPLVPSLPNLDKVVGFFFKMWSNGEHTNTLAFNIDNVALTQPEEVVEIPPPTMALSEATAGLQLTATTIAGANGRQNIRPLNPSYSWVDVGNPVSYKITIKDYPAAPTGFQTHLFLAPEANIPFGPGDTSVDWNGTNLVFVQIQNLESGGGEVRFMYKTNFGSGFGGQIFGSNVLVEASSATMTGTWTITFSNNTSVTVTTPDNTSTNFTFPSESAALFAGPVYAWIGSQANGADKVGLSSVIERIELTGFAADNIDDSFPGPGLDPAIWATVAADAAGVQVVPASTAYWLNWTLPDPGFYAQWSSSLGSAATWADVGITPSTFNGRRWIQIPASLSSDGAFFRLVKREFTKLQILLPGETAAPGTPTGKTGTPTPQQVGAAFDITVRAVSDDWFPLTSVPSQQIDLSSTDPAFSWQGFPGTMVNGQIIFDAETWQLSLGTPGSQTITASNLTDPEKTPDTSSPVTVNP